MKKLLGIVAILSLLFPLSLFANDMGNMNHGKDMGNMMDKMSSKMVKKFKSNGGSAEGIKIVEAALKKSAEATATVKEEMMKLMKQAESVAVAEKFNSGEFIDIHKKMSKEMDKKFMTYSKSIAEALSKLSVEDRKILSNIVAKMHSR